MFRQCHSSLGSFGFMVALVLVLAVAPEGLAQAAPRPPGVDVTSATSLSQDQVASVKAYVEHWTTVLKDSQSKPEDVEKARAALISPLQGIGAPISNDFRFQYSKAALPDLEQAMKSKCLHTAVNAVIVASQLGQDKAMTLLLPLADAQVESRWQIRLRAADGCKLLLDSGFLDSRKAMDAGRKLSDAAQREEDPIILRHQFEAIDAADGPSLKDNADDRVKARAFLVDAVAGVVDRLSQASNNPHPSPLVDPVHAAIEMIRNKYLNNQVGQNEREATGKKLGPAFGQLLGFVATNWDAMQADASSKRLYAAMVGALEGFMPLLDRNVRKSETSPQTKLKDAWVNNQKDKFVADAEKWIAIFKQPPYITR